MLWYGSFYAIISLLLVALFLFILMQFPSRYATFSTSSIHLPFQLILLTFILVSFVTIALSYNSIHPSLITLFDNSSLLLTFNSSYGFEIYYFPFIYIFIFITLISIIFCLAYNYHELNSFLFFCFLIFLSGLMIFLSSSFLIFFFAYEMLLLPSFFILYFFAKTRRSIEAAYLMFF